MEIKDYMIVVFSACGKDINGKRKVQDLMYFVSLLVPYMYWKFENGPYSELVDNSLDYLVKLEYIKANDSLSKPNKALTHRLDTSFDDKYEYSITDSGYMLADNAVRAEPDKCKIIKNFIYDFNRLAYNLDMIDLKPSERRIVEISILESLLPKYYKPISIP